MNFGEPASFLRLLVLACLSSLIVACGQGSGEESVDAGADEITNSSPPEIVEILFAYASFSASGFPSFVETFYSVSSLFVEKNMG